MGDGEGNVGTYMVWGEGRDWEKSGGMSEGGIKIRFIEDPFSSRHPSLSIELRRTDPLGPPRD